MGLLYLALLVAAIIVIVTVADQCEQDARRMGEKEGDTENFYPYNGWGGGWGGWGSGWGSGWGGRYGYPYRSGYSDPYYYPYYNSPSYSWFSPTFWWW